MRLAFRTATLLASLIWAQSASALVVSFTRTFGPEAFPALGVSELIGLQESTDLSAGVTLVHTFLHRPDLISVSIVPRVSFSGSMTLDSFQGGGSGALGVSAFVSSNFRIVVEDIGTPVGTPWHGPGTVPFEVLDDFGFSLDCNTGPFRCPRIRPYDEPLFGAEISVPLIEVFMSDGLRVVTHGGLMLQCNILGQSFCEAENQASWSGSVDFNLAFADPSGVPAPGTFVLLALGLVGLRLSARKYR